MADLLSFSLPRLIGYFLAFQIAILSPGNFGTNAQSAANQTEMQKIATNVANARLTSAAVANPPARIVIPPEGTPDLATALDKARFQIVSQSPQFSAVGGLTGLASIPSPVKSQPVITLIPGAPLPAFFGPPPSTPKPPPTTTFAGYLVGSPYPFVLPPPDIPYFGSKWNGPWGYPIGHYQAFRGTGQYITHYDYYPLSYFGSLMAPFAYGISGKK